MECIAVNKVGDRIRARRQELDLSVDEVAAKLKINRATIYRYESSEIENFSIAVLEPLARILKTTPAYLMGWDESHIDELIENAPPGVVPEELKAIGFTKKDIKLIQTYNRAKNSNDPRVRAMIEAIDKMLGMDERE
jgi:transcriptional regulator with XRE-family HTH domain